MCILPISIFAKVKYLLVRTKEFKGKVYFFLNYVHDPIALVKSSLKVSH